MLEQSKSSDRIPAYVVGLGGSAGSLEPLETFLSHFEPDHPIAFVVVTHRSPGHNAVLVDILARHTSLHVQAAADGDVLERGVVYVVPSEKHFEMKDGRVAMRDRRIEGGLPTAIDSLYRALAHHAATRSGAVLFSGMGSDGKAGLRAIRLQHGHTFAQEPSSALYGAMASAAISAGLVEFVGTPAQLAEQVKAIALLEPLPVALPVVVAPPGPPQRFFRPPSFWNALRDVTLPALLDRHPPESTFRAWISGCASGEDAYALAIVLSEASKARPRPDELRIRLYATDRDSAAIARARHGVYPLTIREDIDRDRVDRFFTLTQLVGGGGAYRIARDIRDLVVFGTHDLDADPLFRKLDLLVCRDAWAFADDAHKEPRRQALLHALVPRGLLVLGDDDPIEPPERWRGAAPPDPRCVGSDGLLAPTSQRGER